MTLAEAVARYGPITDGKWIQEAQWCTLLQVQADIAQYWINSLTGKPTTHVYCNKEMAPALNAALINVRARGLIRELHTFDGCFEARDVRGMPGKVSTHSYALAVDANAATNPLGKVGDISSALVQCFKDAGFKWGGDFARKDFMHFQFALW